jgi:hypothetical protein
VLGEHSAEQRRDSLDAEASLEPDQDVPCTCTGGDVLDACVRPQMELKASFEAL